MDDIIKQALVEKIERLEADLTDCRRGRAAILESYSQLAIFVHNKTSDGNVRTEADAHLDRIRDNARGGW